MKTIKESVIRKIIRNIILENQSVFDQDGAQTAIFKFDNSSAGFDVCIMAVDSNGIKKTIEELFNNEKNVFYTDAQWILIKKLRPHIDGLICLSTPQKKYGQCEGAYEVVVSYSNPNGRVRGRDLYNMAAAWAAEQGLPIMSDRISVSKEAARIWQYWGTDQSGYHSSPNSHIKNRDNRFANELESDENSPIAKQKNIRPVFDDVEDPRTEDPGDDCLINRQKYNGQINLDLNRAYWFSGNDGGLESGIHVGEALEAEIEKLTGNRIMQKIKFAILKAGIEQFGDSLRARTR